jgi:flavin-binding protein dodecin
LQNPGCYVIGEKEAEMKDKVFKKIRVVGCSSVSYEKAIQLAVKKASKTLKGLSWFEVTELRGAILNGKITEWQATLDLSFKIGE